MTLQFGIDPRAGRGEFRFVGLVRDRDVGLMHGPRPRPFTVGIV